VIHEHERAAPGFCIYSHGAIVSASFETFDPTQPRHAETLAAAEAAQVCAKAERTNRGRGRADQFKEAVLCTGTG
jgi:hypothetical protein